MQGSRCGPSVSIRFMKGIKTEETILNYRYPIT